MTERAKISDDIKIVSWMTNWTIKRAVSSSLICVQFWHISLHNRTEDSLPWWASPDGEVQPFVLTLQWNLWWDINTQTALPGRPTKCIAFQVTTKDLRGVGGGGYLTETPTRTECARDWWKNISLYRQWEAWYSTLVILLPVNIRGGSIFRERQHVAKHYYCQINKCTRNDIWYMWN